MAKNLPAIREIVRQVLRDEILQGTAPDFDDDEISVIINETVSELSIYAPREVKETITAAASKDQDISTITDLIKVLYAEYTVDQSPKNIRNVSVFGETLTLDTSTTPAAGESIYLYCHKYHTLGDSSTLTAEQERVLVDGVVAKLILNYTSKLRTQIAAAIAAIDNINSAVDAVSAQLSSATTDLTSGRSEIAKVSTVILQASTAITAISGLYSAATADLASARTYINTITVGADPVAKYLGVAQSGVAVANGQTSEAYARLRQAEADESLGGAYSMLAARELSNANTSLAQSQGYARELQSRLQIGNIISSYQTQARERLALYRQELRDLVKPFSKNVMKPQ